MRRTLGLMWARDFALLLVVSVLWHACGSSSSKKSGHGKGEAGAPSTGGSAGTSPAGGTGGSAAASGEGGAGIGGEGGAPSCDECPDGLVCHAELGCATVCTESELLVITNEAELSSFAARGCQVLDGTLVIRSPSLVDLAALGTPSPLRIIERDLLVEESPVLESLAGFAGLERIGGSLVVRTSTVETLDGLESLRRVGSDPVANTLVITENPRLSSVAALGGLTRLETSVVVYGNAALTSLAGVVALRTAGNVTVALNPALVRLDGLAELEASDSISVAGNESLVELLLPSLGNVGTLSITGHASLASVGLPVLSSAGNLTVADNLVLTTLGTLDALTEVDSLIIAGNPMLPQCFVDELDERLMACSSTCGGNDTTALCE